MFSSRKSLISFCGASLKRNYAKKQYVYKNRPNGKGPMDGDFDQINNMHLDLPTNSSPPSHWDRISPHENPPVYRPSQVYQALAPPEGLPPVRVRRIGKKKYWKPTTMMLVLWLLTFYGIYRTELWRKTLRLYLQEEELHRSALIPFLQAEKDIAYSIEKRAFDAKVIELMKDEPNFIFKSHFYNRQHNYTQPIVVPTLLSFEETGLLHRDIERLAEYTNRKDYNITGVDHVRSLKNKIKELQEKSV